LNRTAKRSKQSRGIDRLLKRKNFTFTGGKHPPIFKFFPAKSGSPRSRLVEIAVDFTAFDRVDYRGKYAPMTSKSR
jgi:hypothetical protein